MFVVYALKGHEPLSARKRSVDRKGKLVPLATDSSQEMPEQFFWEVLVMMLKRFPGLVVR